MKIKKSYAEGGTVHVGFNWVIYCPSDKRWEHQYYHDHEHGHVAHIELEGKRQNSFSDGDPFEQPKSMKTWLKKKKEELGCSPPDDLFWNITDAT